jgi:hypothetical protein
VNTKDEQVGATDFQDLTTEEAAAIRSLHRLSRKWPKTLTLFASGTLTVRKPNGGFPGKDTVVADIFGIPNDGGDGGDNEHD